MPTKDEILKLAQSLGQAIAECDAYKAHAAAQQAVNDDADAQVILRDYSQAAQKIQQAQAQGQPIEPADKHQLADCEQKLSGNDRIKVLMRTQADYFALMNSVNQAMSAPLNPANPPA